MLTVPPSDPTKATPSEGVGAAADRMARSRDRLESRDWSQQPYAESVVGSSPAGPLQRSNRRKSDRTWARDDRCEALIGVNRPISRSGIRRRALPHCASVPDRFSSTVASPPPLWPAAIQPKPTASQPSRPSSFSLSSTYSACQCPCSFSTLYCHLVVMGARLEGPSDGFGSRLERRAQVGCSHDAPLENRATSSGSASGGTLTISGPSAKRTSNSATVGEICPRCGPLFSQGQCPVPPRRELEPESEDG